MALFEDARDSDIAPARDVNRVVADNQRAFPFREDRVIAIFQGEVDGLLPYSVGERIHECTSERGSLGFTKLSM
ncbi:MAG: hypothetical protein JWN34_1532 [Bryobacterales bacterium]|nr:hypothetical protein [Bryobacterales bacterium]